MVHLEERVHSLEQLNLPVTQEQVRALHEDMVELTKEAKVTRKELGGEIKGLRRTLIGLLVSIVMFAVALAATAIQLAVVHF